MISNKIDSNIAFRIITLSLRDILNLDLKMFAEPEKVESVMKWRAKEAVEWFFSEEEHIGSARWCCDQLFGYNHQALQDWLRRYQESDIRAKVGMAEPLPGLSLKKLLKKTRQALEERGV